MAFNVSPLSGGLVADFHWEWLYFLVLHSIVMCFIINDALSAMNIVCNRTPRLGPAVKLAALFPRGSFCGLGRLASPPSTTTDSSGVS